MLREEASAVSAGLMADVYSLGVVIWEMYTGKLPWEGMVQYQIMMVVATQKRHLDIPPRLPPVIQKLLSACWEHEPSKRPTMQKIKADFSEATPGPARPYHNLNTP